jgi:type IV pilus assembly protein PilM
VQLGSLLNRNRHPYLGIDIGSSTIKLAAVVRDGDNFRLEHLAVEQLDPAAMDHNSIKNPSKVSEALSRVWYQSAAKHKECVLAVPLTSTFSRMLYLPAGQSESELESQVQIEAGQIVPFELNEVSLDFQVVGVAPGDEGLIEVLLAASRTENVNQLESIVDEAGLELAIVDIDKYALLNSFISLLETPALREKTIALMHIGAHSIIFMAVKDRKELYVKAINFGTAQLEHQVAESINDEADAIASLEEPDARTDEEIIQPFRHQLVLQINRALQAYASSSQYHRIEHVILSGGGSRLLTLAEHLHDELELPVEVADYSTRLTIGSKVSKRLLKTHGPALALALGLAIRGCE